MCLTPFFRKDDPGTSLPCGKCETCRKRRASGWSFRLNQEAKRANTGWFITLTYDNEHVCFSKDKRMTLVKKHVQDFMKLLRHYETRKLKNKVRLKYYAVGEYGTTYWRPHYHIILFNSVSLSKWIGKAKSGADLYDVTSVSASWKHGATYSGKVQEASVGYTLKYLSKVKRVPAYAGDLRLPEFSLMSKRLGDNYLSEAMVGWHKSDLLDRMYVPLPDGKKAAMPRYFKDKIYELEEREAIKVHAKKRIAEKEQEEIAKYGDRLQHVKDVRAIISADRLSKKIERPSNF